MKVFIIFCYAHDETNVQEVWADEAKAIARCKEREDTKTSQYEEYFVEKWEVR